MRTVFILALVLFFHSCFGQNKTQQAEINIDSLISAKEQSILGKPFPTFAATNEQGLINNDSLLGKVVLINFWFEGCHPCIAEFGALNELADQLKDNKNFVFISFTWDNEETVKRVKEKHKLLFKVFRVNGVECRRLNQNSAYPTMLILNKQGVIKYWADGGPIDPVKARQHVMSELLPKIQQELQ